MTPKVETGQTMSVKIHYLIPLKKVSPLDGITHRAACQRAFDAKPLHITLAIPRTLKGDGCDHTYFQSVCSCGWHGTYRASKLTAQMDTCPNK
jgi:hypothetical protein